MLSTQQLMSLAAGFDTWLRAIGDPEENGYATHPFGPNGAVVQLQDMTMEQRGDLAHLSLTGLWAEIGEIAEEVGWKPWSNSRGWTNKEAVVREAADVLRFLANLLRLAGATGGEVAVALREGLRESHDRVVEYEQRRMHVAR